MASREPTPPESPGEGERRRDPIGLGAPIALLVIVGAILGSMMGQPSIGFLGGLALGLLIALAFWLRDRR